VIRIGFVDAGGILGRCRLDIAAVGLQLWLE
jgi:hypothetical protein